MHALPAVLHWATLKLLHSTLFKPKGQGTPKVPRRTCVAVFHLPTQLTATAECASGPSAAAHSRSALIVISRPITAARIKHEAGCNGQWLDVMHRPVMAARTRAQAGGRAEGRLQRAAAMFGCPTAQAIVDCNSARASSLLYHRLADLPVNHAQTATPG